MEKAILKTLIYSNLFEYPLKIDEIHKWLIRKKATPREIEKALKILSKKRRIGKKKDFFFLRGKEAVVSKRFKRVKQSLVYIRKAKVISFFLKSIPWIKLVGISGGLSMENADKRDDIDLFIITSKNRLWLARLLTLGVLNILGQRRKVEYSLRKASGKICCNIFLEEDKLFQKRHDLYIAHEVLQMRVLYEKDNTYSKYLVENEWVFKFLPNWVGVARGPASSVSRRASSIAIAPAATRQDPSSLSPLAFFELISKRIQMKIMRRPKGMERIEEGALYFHPNDIREYVLKTFKKKIERLEN